MALLCRMLLKNKKTPTSSLHTKLKYNIELLREIVPFQVHAATSAVFVQKSLLTFGISSGLLATNVALISEQW